MKSHNLGRVQYLLIMLSDWFILDKSLNTIIQITGRKALVYQLCSQKFAIPGKKRKIWIYFQITRQLTNESPNGWAVRGIAIEVGHTSNLEVKLCTFIEQRWYEKSILDTNIQIQKKLHDRYCYVWGLVPFHWGIFHYIY